MKLENAHMQRINYACYLGHQKDEPSNLIASGCDQGIIKIWDKRTMKNSNSFAGGFLGHLEGITHMVARQDGNYIASNSKDQLLKLWDMRMMLSQDKIIPNEKPGSSLFNFTN